MELTVLLIDGDCEHAHRVQQFLSQSRPAWQLDHAASLAQAQQLHAQRAPQVAVVCLRQVDGDGLQALSWLGHTLALVVVRTGQEGLAAQAMRAGFADFVVRTDASADASGSCSYLQTLPEQIENLARQGATAAALAAQSRELSTTLASVSQGIISLDTEGRVRVYNDRALELIDVPPAMLEGTPYLNQIVEFQRERGEFVGCEVYWPPGATLGASNAQGCPPVYIRRTLQGRYLEVRTHQE